MKSEKPKDIDAYLAGVSEPAHSTLQAVRSIIRSVVPADAIETISYGMPTFEYKGPLVGFAAFKDHCSFFPMNASLVNAFQSQLQGFKTSKGTIQFPSDKPLPAALLKKMVKARIAENKRYRGKLA